MDNNKIDQYEEWISQFPIKYYNSGSALGIIGTHVGHTSGEWTFMVGAGSRYQWIKTKDLYDSREEAEVAYTAEIM